MKHIFIILLLSAISCSSLQADMDMELLLMTDFDGVQVKETSNPTADVLELYNPNLDIGIQYGDDNSDNRYARVVTDFANSTLKYWMQQTDTKKGRIQVNLTDINKTSVRERFRMYLHPDLKHYSTYPKENTWFTINEMWIGNTRDRKKHDHPFRISLTIAKEAGINVPLRFFVHGDTQAQFKGKWSSNWYQANKEYEVPIGEWMTVEISYKQGNQEIGHYYVAAKRDSEDTMTTIFDITDWTYSPQASKPAKLVAWNPLKLYTSVDVIDHIRDAGGVAQIYWDDMEIWGNK